MAIIMLSGSSGGGAVAASDGDTYVVGSGTVFGTAGVAFDLLASTNVTLSVDGRLFSSAEVAAMVGAATSHATVEVCSDGEVQGAHTGVYLAGSFAHLTNSGVVQAADDGAAVRVAAGASATIYNDGIIAAGTGLAIAASGTIVTNEGLIAGDTLGILRTGDGVFAFHNVGVLSGTLALYSNAGSINTVINTGLLSGGNTAIAGGLGHDVVRNAGAILGAVRLGGGDDSYIAIGPDATSGLISGGDGRDTIVGGGDGERIVGGTGGDNLVGGDGADTIAGGTGADTVQGGDGGDRLLGGSEVDRIVGGAGEDTVNGNDGHDIIFGGLDADSLAGGIGNDLLRGEAGADRVAGLAGNDTLIGGTGDDVIALGAGADLVVLAAGDGRDIVTGVSANDRIDLSAFDEDAVAIGGTAAGVEIGFGADSLLLAGMTLDRFDRDQLIF